MWGCGGGRLRRRMPGPRPTAGVSDSTGDTAASARLGRASPGGCRVRLALRDCVPGVWPAAVSPLTPASAHGGVRSRDRHDAHARSHTPTGAVSPDALGAVGREAACARPFGDPQTTVTARESARRDARGLPTLSVKEAAWPKGRLNRRYSREPADAAGATVKGSRRPWRGRGGLGSGHIAAAANDRHMLPEQVWAPDGPARFPARRGDPVREAARLVARPVRASGVVAPGRPPGRAAENRRRPLRRLSSVGAGREGPPPRPSISAAGSRSRDP
jgi:hypothetical protein